MSAALLMMLLILPALALPMGAPKADDVDDVINEQAFTLAQLETLDDTNFLTINGNEGDDTISIDGFTTSYISGGDGDDDIEALEMQGIASGDDGDDVIVLAGSAAIAYGGAGNDDLSISGNGELGAGYAKIADGGDGDDTLRYEGGALAWGAPIEDPATLTGGSGNDQFLLDISERSNFLYREGDSLTDKDVVIDGALQLRTVSITDFAPGEDVIVIDAQADDPAFNLTTARLEESTDLNGNPHTGIVLTYTNEEELNRDVKIVLEGEGTISWDDIVFQGADVPVLL